MEGDDVGIAEGVPGQRVDGGAEQGGDQAEGGRLRASPLRARLRGEEGERRIGLHRERGDRGGGGEDEGEVERGREHLREAAFSKVNRKSQRAPLTSLPLCHADITA